MAATSAEPEDIDRMKQVFEERTSQDHHVAREDDTVFISPSSSMEQDGLLVAVNGYLESDRDLTERYIAEMYREHGRELPSRLNGSYRILIYDAGDERLYAFADKVGRKVIYRREIGDDIICCSHLTPMLAHGEVDAELDREGLRHFLQSWSVSFAGGPRLIKDVKRIYPSHLLTWSDGNISETKYWDVYDTRRNVSDEEAVRQMDRLLDDAAETLVDRTSEPLNVFLSGGFDSVFLTTLMSEKTDKQIDTYTWGWKDEHFKDAEKMSDMLGTNQHSLKLDYTLPDARDIYFHEEPHNAFVRYPFRQLYEEDGMRSYWTGLNSQATFPVCLKNVRKLDRLRPLRKLVRRLPGNPESIAGMIDYHASKGVYIMRSDNLSEAAVNDWGLRGDQAREMLSGDLRNETSDVAEVLDEKWGLEEKSYQENYSYLQLRARDTARYAYYSQHMEHIDVFGYTPLMEYSYSLPMRQKKNRRLLQKIAKGRVPDRIITKGASGWEFVSEQFKQKILHNRQEYERQIDDFIGRGHVDDRVAREVLLDNYRAAGKGRTNQMIAVYLLEKWLKNFIDRENPWKEPGGDDI